MSSHIYVYQSHIYVCSELFIYHCPSSSCIGKCFWILHLQELLMRQLFHLQTVEYLLKSAVFNHIFNNFVLERRLCINNKIHSTYKLQLTSKFNIL